MRVFQNLMESGRPSRSRGPGSNSKKKSASSSSKERSPLGMTLMGSWSESEARGVIGGGVISWVEPAGGLAAAVGGAPTGGVNREDRRSSALSPAGGYPPGPRLRTAPGP